MVQWWQTVVSTLIHTMREDIHVAAPLQILLDATHVVKRNAKLTRESRPLRIALPLRSRQRGRSETTCRPSSAHRERLRRRDAALDRGSRKPQGAERFNVLSEANANSAAPQLLSLTSTHWQTARYLPHRAEGGG